MFDIFGINVQSVNVVACFTFKIIFHKILLNQWGRIDQQENRHALYIYF